VHDRYRKYKSGRAMLGTSARARDVLVTGGVAVNALVVVNDHSAPIRARDLRYPPTKRLE
jgi:sulfatase maturation enzyme AslB (radical SAM superfamily)